MRINLKAWWGTPEIPAPGRPRQEDWPQFEGQSGSHSEGALSQKSQQGKRPKQMRATSFLGTPGCLAMPLESS